MPASEGWAWDDNGRSEDQAFQASRAPWAPVFARRRSAHIGPTLKIILLGLAILGAGGYGLYVGRFGRPTGPRGPVADGGARDRRTRPGRPRRCGELPRGRRG